MLKQKQKNNFCAQYVVNLYFSWNSMNNLFSYCGLTDSRMRASDTDLTVLNINGAIVLRKLFRISVRKNCSSCWDFFFSNFMMKDKYSSNEIRKTQNVNLNIVRQNLNHLTPVVNSKQISFFFVVVAYTTCFLM